MWKRPDRDDPTGAACVIDSGGSSGRRRMGCRKQPANKRPVRLKRSKGCIKRPVGLKRNEGCIARPRARAREPRRSRRFAERPPTTGTSFTPSRTKRIPPSSSSASARNNRYARPMGFCWPYEPEDSEALRAVASQRNLQAIGQTCRSTRNATRRLAVRRPRQGTLRASRRRRASQPRPGARRDSPREHTPPKK